MLQGWYWDYPKDGCNGYSGASWASTLQTKAATLGSAGFTYVWLPPMSRASFGSCSNGYAPKDLYDIGLAGEGPTGFGTQSQVNTLISALNTNGIQAVADVVYNHRDGGNAENNPALRDYITQYYDYNGGTIKKEPFPTDRYRVVIPIGSGTPFGPGDFYFKISSKSGHSRFHNKHYRVYMQTDRVGWQSLTDLSESEPNGGGDCGESNNDIFLGRNMNAHIDAFGCLTDEFHLNLTANDLNTTDNLYIYYGNDEGYTDHRIYGIWYDPEGPAGGFNVDLNTYVNYQTYTDFSGLPSGQGAMNFEHFKPNSANASYTWLEGDWDYLYFFYDYDQDRQITRDVLNAWSKWLWTDVGIRGFRMDAVKHFNPNFVGQLMDYLAGQGISPQLVVGEYFDSNPATLTNWIGSVYSNMNSASVNIRAFDFALRQALKNACDQYHYSFNFDTRDIFQSGIVDGAGGSGLNAITFINNHDFRDSDQPVLEDPILAYAYILTNNKVGLPCVFYPEYFGIAPDNYPVVNLKSRIDSLIQIHKNNIYLAPQVEYLNRHSTSRQSNYISGSADKALIYQISGGISNKDVLVAINFGNTTLKVDHELNTADAPVGTQFNRIMGSSPFSYGVVSASSGGVPNSMYIQLPPRSFSVWLAGDLVLPLELTRFEAVNTAKSVRLNWETQAENQVLEYILERSESGNAFAPIAAVPAKNSPSAAYDYTDPWVASQGIRYYRLRMVDMDGQVEYSPVRTVVREATLENRIRLFPNPAEKEISISWDIPQFTRLQVFSVLGQPVLDMDVTGELTQEISLTGIQPGVYYAILSDASGAREILRFVRK